MTGLSKKGHKDLNCGCTYLCVVAVFVTIVTKSHDLSSTGFGDLASALGDLVLRASRNLVVWALERERSDFVKVSGLSGSRV